MSVTGEIGSKLWKFLIPRGNYRKTIEILRSFTRISQILVKTRGIFDRISQILSKTLRIFDQIPQILRTTRGVLSGIRGIFDPIRQILGMTRRVRSEILGFFDWNPPSVNRRTMPLNGLMDNIAGTSSAGLPGCSLSEDFHYPERLGSWTAT